MEAILKNRKQRRYEASLMRKRFIPKRDGHHWHKRIINEMKQNAKIQEKIVDGTFDQYLN